MALTGLPDFTSRELLTAAKLNSMITSIENKFNAGITKDDMAWPFAVGGNIDMRFYQILNIPRFWKVYNVADRDVASGVTVQNVFTTVKNEGGGIVYVPPHTTVSAGDITIASNIAVLGGDWSSVIQILSSTTNQGMFRPEDGATNIAFMNIKLDGSTNTSTKSAVESRAAGKLRFFNVFFSAWRGPALELGNAGVDGTGTQDCWVDHCSFDSTGQATSGSHINITDVDKLDITNCTFGGLAHAGCITALGANNTRKVKDVLISDCRFKVTVSNASYVIRFIKSSATLTTDQAGLTIRDCFFDGGSASSRCGIDIKDWFSFTITNNVFRDDTSAFPSIRVQNSQFFTISDNHISNRPLGGDGIVIGSTGYDGTALGARADLPCFDYTCRDNIISLVGSAGIIITGGSKRWNLLNNRIADASQATNNTYCGIEYWHTGSSINTDGSLLQGNTYKDVTAGVPNALQGFETYAAGGAGSAVNTNIGGVAESAIRVIGNTLSGMAAGGADFAADAGTHLFQLNTV